jgi:serine protease Do
MRKIFSKSFIAATALMLSLSMTGFPLTGAIPSAFAASSFQTPSSFADLSEAVKHSVVNIFTTQVVSGKALNPFMGPDSPFRGFFGDDFFKHFFGDMPQGQMKTHALGSGFVIDNQGLILTNNHVVEKATEIKVKLEKGKEYTAKVLGRDPKTDLALIKVKADGDFPKPLILGDSDATRVGDWVMAVGNPFGLGETVTVGIISARGRIIGAGPYDDFIQTDAAINPGNSGGPLFNMKGEVVGINTAIVAQGQGIGFAIPINMAKELLPQLEAGKVVRGWIGVVIQEITPELAKSFDLKDIKGVLVSEVTKGSPAEHAGLKQGDVITGFNGKPVENAHTLPRLVAATAPDSKAKLDIVRDGKTMSVGVTIGNMPQSMEEAKASPEKDEAWGMSVQDITPEIAQQLGLDAHEHGVVVANVQPGSAAGDAGLRPGDVIKEINRQKIKNVSDYNQAVQKNKDRLLLLVKRGSGSIFIVLQTNADG